jgi:7,8-dihydropterin-6-yl-methyl-4-(beta-D-ribofuranosyl)aminobenzene 5'-phosphate synthase
MPPNSTIRITVVYDDRSLRPNLIEDRGFSAFIEYEEENILFDAGKDGKKLLHNLEQLGISPQAIQRVFISHPHLDHYGGLEGLFSVGVHPEIYLLSSFPDILKEKLSIITKVVEVEPGQKICSYCYSTGELNRGIPEHAAVFESRAGLIVLTGCAHPGVVEFVYRVMELSTVPIDLLAGGFHLKNEEAGSIQNTVSILKRARIRRIAPCHCTGDVAKQHMRQQFGQGFVQIGSGAKLLVG